MFRLASRDRYNPIHSYFSAVIRVIVAKSDSHSVPVLLILMLSNCLISNFFAEDNSMCTPTARDSYERLSLAGQTLPPGFPSPFLFPDGLSSIETLLTNIQVLSPV